MKALALIIRLLYILDILLTDDGLTPPNAMLTFEGVAPPTNLDFVLKRPEVATVFLETVGALPKLSPNFIDIDVP